MIRADEDRVNVLYSPSPMRDLLPEKIRFYPTLIRINPWQRFFGLPQQLSGRFHNNMVFDKRHFAHLSAHPLLLAEQVPHYDISILGMDIIYRLKKQFLLTLLFYIRPQIAHRRLSLPLRRTLKINKPAVIQGTAGYFLMLLSMLPGGAAQRIEPAFCVMPLLSAMYERVPHVGFALFMFAG